ncbi:MAG: transglutaminase domain-containing protein [Salinibacterium sp.]|nr:MAG: transglutaminase domain-containing protein [Salinibacterium sp.]
MLCLATVIASVALWPIYRSASLVVLIGVALVLGAAIAVAGAYFRWRAWVVMLATLGAFLIVGVPVAVPSEARFGVLPTLDGLRDLTTGVALGWKQLLTISLPVGGYQALLVPALVLVLSTVVIGLSIALRARNREAAVLAPIVLFLVATAFGPNYPSRPLDVPIALLAVTLFWLVWSRWYRRRSAIRLLTAQSVQANVPFEPPAAPKTDRGSGLRTVVSAALILVIASATAVGATLVLPPASNRAVLRTSIQQPFDPRDYVSPLSGFRRYLKPGTADTVLLDVSGLPKGSRIRIATLDTYEGVVYTVGSDKVSSESGSFTRVPDRFDQTGVRGAKVQATVTVRGYSGPWLPSIGQFESIQFNGNDAATLRDAFYYNNTSGTAATIGGLHSGDSYTLDAVIPKQPKAGAIAELKPGVAVVPKLKNVPDELTAKLSDYVEGVEGSGPRLSAMLAGLAADGYISHGIAADEPPSRSGHASDRIAELFTTPRMIGDAEQYSVAAALMAQQLGFPSRVVFGFAPKGEQVRGSDVSAWIEVNTAQYGWVAIDPTPPFRPIPDELPKDKAQVSRPPTIVPPPVVESEAFDRQSTPDSEQNLPPDLDPTLVLILGILRVLGWIVLVAAILLAPFMLVIAAKLRRRKLRRAAPDAIQQISGGWQEFEDAVLDHGFSPVPSATRSEVAAVAGGMPSAMLAIVADRAVFSPDEPDPAEVDEVWRAVDELEASLNAGLSRLQRLRVRISLRSLGGYSVRTLFKR